MVIPGTEKSAHQAVKARGEKIRPKRPQRDPGGLFDRPALPQADLFGENSEIKDPK
jgi:hypothetical protein